MGKLLLQFADLLMENDEIGYRYYIQITIARAVYLLTFPLVGGLWLMCYFLASYYLFGFDDVDINFRILVFSSFASVLAAVGLSYLTLTLTILFVFIPTEYAISRKISGLSRREAINQSALEFQTLFRNWNERQVSSINNE